MGIRNTKPFLPLDDEHVSALAGHMGVFEFATDGGEVVYIGFAGGRSRFGLRGDIDERRSDSKATRFRFEVTTAYLTRFQELLMVHVADFGRLPVENNSSDVPKLGKLSPG